MSPAGKKPMAADPIREATLIQELAARPDRSVVLKAGAGSGKTTALANRFLRLCIETAPGAGPVHPRSILAVTFTRKAAVEIKERLLAEAVALVDAEDDQLNAKLEKLFGRQPKPQEKVLAAGLYEQILEHPHGLKIGTIHYFCQLILGRFAVEAGLDPSYSVLEDPSELIDEALDALEKELALDVVLSTEARRLGKDPGAIRNALRRVFSSRMRLDRWCAQEEAQSGASKEKLDLASLLQQRLKAILLPELEPQQEPDLSGMFNSLANSLADFSGPGMDGVLQTLGAEAAEISPSSQDKLRQGAEAAAQACRAATIRIRAVTDPVTMAAVERAVQPVLDSARGTFLTKNGQPRSFFRGRKNPDLTARFNDLVLVAGQEVLTNLRRFTWRDLYLKNSSLFHLGFRTLGIYARLKQRDKVVDFQDLEALAARLMGDEAQALSLLFRLDDSITHIMVDEFQDTNFNQKDILWPLVEEFLSGGSGQTGSPTVFFVGDIKQSIYSFRGAEPSIFQALTQRPMQPGIIVNPRTWGDVQVLTLPTNFRSLPAVTEGVGRLFSHPPLDQELGALGVMDLQQHCARKEAEGKLYILPPFAPQGGESGLTGDQLAAAAAAELVSKLVQEGTKVWCKGSQPPQSRPMEWRDVLVLFRVRTRVGLYEDAFRQAGIPISPSGRGALAASREIQDLLALLRWLVWPEDDIALATVLRSPLFRLSQQELQTVLAKRGLLDQKPDGSGYRTPRGLWSVLRKSDNDPVVGRAVRLLKHWRDRLGFVHGHDLLRLIYREGEVLARYRAALDDQAVFNLMRIHDLTLGREMASLPTVHQLIKILERAARTGGQEEGLVPDGSESGRVRFMTIHGAKGLEAPVVLLVDADAATGKEDSQVILNPADSCSPILLVTSKQDRQPTGDGVGSAHDPVVEAARFALAKDRVEEANLEYVAMTRARDQLYILGGDKSNGKGDYDSPLRRILRSAEAANDPRLLRELPPELASESKGDQSVASSSDPTPKSSKGLLPGWRQTPKLTLPERITILTPSAGDWGEQGTERPATQAATKADSATANQNEPRGVRHGLQVHSLLEAATRWGQMPPGDGSAWAEANSVFNHPDFRWIFHPQEMNGRGLSEAPVIAERPDAGTGQVRERITGVIDRLILRPDQVDIIDYKTNRCALQVGLQEALVEHYRPQLEMYQEVVRALYPNRKLRAWLLFTDPELVANKRLCPVD